MKLTTQEAFVLNILQRERSITRLKATHYNVGNVNAVIGQLRMKGWAIGTMTRTDARGQTYVEWTFIGWDGRDMRPNAEAIRRDPPRQSSQHAAERANAAERRLVTTPRERSLTVVGGTAMSQDLATAVVSLVPRGVR